MFWLKIFVMKFISIIRLAQVIYSISVVPLVTCLCSYLLSFYSLGADAHVLLEFHESRQANPEKFNSQIKNKIKFAAAGSKDLLKRTWKDLVDHVKIEVSHSHPN